LTVGQTDYLKCLLLTDLVGKIYTQIRNNIMWKKNEANVYEETITAKISKWWVQKYRIQKMKHGYMNNDYIKETTILDSELLII